MVSIYMLFISPEGAGALHLFLWMFLLSIGQPYYTLLCLGCRAMPDYNERSRITGGRSISGVVGSLSAQLIPTIALVFLVGGSTNVLYIVGIASVIIMPILCF